MIERKPGINSSKITCNLNIGRNTVKYHIVNVLKKDLISLKLKGNKIELFQN